MRRTTTDHHDEDRYEIRIDGHLDRRWAARFDGLALRLEDDGTTVLTGPVTDQAALHGLLGRIRDLGLPLVSVTRLDPPNRRGDPARGSTTTITAHESRGDVP